MVVGLDATERARLWSYRELQSEAFSSYATEVCNGAAHKLDVSVPLPRLAEVADLIRARFRVACRKAGIEKARFVLDTLQAEGLDCRFVRRDPLHPTGFQLKSREETGDDPRVEYFRRGSAASHLSLDDLAPALLQARHLHAQLVL